MTDIALRWARDAGYGDVALAGADLAADDGLATAVIVSLFTDRRVGADELAPGETDRRGWWADLATDDGDQIGSRLWLLDRAKTSADVPVRAAAYAREALEWMVDDGVADRVDASAEWVRPGRLRITAVVARGGATLYRDAFEVSLLGDPDLGS